MVVHPSRRVTPNLCLVNLKPATSEDWNIQSSLVSLEFANHGRANFFFAGSARDADAVSHSMCNRHHILPRIRRKLARLARGGWQWRQPRNRAAVDMEQLGEYPLENSARGTVQFDAHHLGRPRVPHPRARRRQTPGVDRAGSE